MNYTITHCPNLPEVRQALSRLHCKGYRHRHRGRGPRFSAHVGDRYWQTLPLDLATHFTLYGTKAGSRWWQDGPYKRFAFVGIEASGKPRIRIVQGDRT
jgi:hypothetical protein